VYFVDDEMCVVVEGGGVVSEQAHQVSRRNYVRT
jgi:hypothetical protein